MTPNAIGWESPPLTTTSVEATILYRDGIAALVTGLSDAARLLDQAVEHDPGFLLAHVGVAVTRVVGGGTYSPPATTTGRAGRGERQHAEIVATALAGDRRRADDLRREHLLEYPGDVLIVWLPTLCPPPGRGPS
jgi:hypothetical protein